MDERKMPRKSKHGTKLSRWEMHRELKEIRKTHRKANNSKAIQTGIEDWAQENLA